MMQGGFINLIGFVNLIRHWDYLKINYSGWGGGGADVCGVLKCMGVLNKTSDHMYDEFTKEYISCSVLILQPFAKQIYTNCFTTYI